MEEDVRLHTNVKNPPETDRLDETTVVEALNPQGKGKASPRTYTIPSSLPKEDGDGATGHASNDRREDKHSAEGFAGRIDGGEDTKFENEDNADEREGIETD
jgi:hypothetical protein